NKESKNLIIKSKPNYVEGALFNHYFTEGKFIEEQISEDIYSRIPISLYLQSDIPNSFSAEFDALRGKLDQVSLEQGTAKKLATRAGAVIQAWNIFRHFYPYFDVIKRDWNELLSETLHSVIKDKDENDCVLSLRKMTVALEDGHASVRHSARASLISLPIYFAYVENEIVVLASNDEQIKRGDILMEFNDKPAKEVLFKREELHSGSPQWRRYLALSYFTAREKGLESKIKIMRAGEEHIFAIKHEKQRPKAFQREQIEEIEEGIYYVDLDAAPMSAIKSKIAEIAKAQGVIFDLRGYPKGNHDVIKHMIDRKVKSARWMIPQILYPNMTNVAGYDTSGRWSMEPAEPRIQGKIVFLTNGRAISYAESFMGIIEHYKLAEIIGSPTAGANGNINPFTTLGGFRFSWTGMKVLKQDKSQHHLIGIQPTILMYPTIEGLAKGKDELLEKALELLR
ncbi:MAG: S41 family peptidase, partial [Bacteroidota bacterium]